jgi:hypothetical protein
VDAHRIETSEAAGLRFRLASPRTASFLGAVAVLLLTVGVALTILTHDLRTSNNGFDLPIVIGFAVVGVVVGRREPRNAVGWILLSVAVVVLIQDDAQLYAVLDYRVHDGALPFGRVDLFWVDSYTVLPMLLGFPAILLFPDGRLPAERWRRLLRAYVVAAVLFMLAQIVAQASIPIGAHPAVNIQGNDVASQNPSGFANDVEFVAWLAALVFVVFWVSFVGHQAAEWRRSTGERREQLKWLMSGAALCVIGAIVVILSSNGNSTLAKITSDLASLAIVALPVSFGVAILKYRLYDIDRLISRTLSYAIITGLLAGVFIGIVVLATHVLPFSSPVGVAASTLTAAALFNPLRRRVQHGVDRRFNRARYDAEAIVTAFTMRLRDAVDLDTVRGELLSAVDRAVEPAHASVWLRPPNSAS